MKFILATLPVALALVSASSLAEPVFAPMPFRHTKIAAVDPNVLFRRQGCPEGTRICDTNFCTDGVCCKRGNGQSCPIGSRCTKEGCCENDKECDGPATCTPYTANECPGKEDCCNSAMPYCARDDRGRAVCTDNPDAFKSYDKVDKEDKKENENEKEEEEPSSKSSSKSSSTSTETETSSTKASMSTPTSLSNVLDELENDNDVEGSEAGSSVKDAASTTVPSGTSPLSVTWPASLLLGGAAMLSLLL